MSCLYSYVPLYTIRLDCYLRPSLSNQAGGRFQKGMACRQAIAGYRIGRSTSSEIMQPYYRFLDQDLKLSVTGLSKGELLVEYAVFRQPVKIMFPKPAYKQE